MHGSEERGLLDPTTCGEDLAHNAARIIDLVPTYCVDCADYHLLHSLKRLAQRAKADSDRVRLFGRIATLFRRQSERNKSPVDFVIAGSADTNLLATCAHAVFAEGKAEREQVRFTVLDRCRTPLELCHDYADRHGLHLTTNIVDFLDIARSYPADIIVQHSLFNFLPFERHEAVLRTFGDWLKPQGTIIFVNSTNPSAKKEHIEARRAREYDRIRRAVESGMIHIAAPAESLHVQVKQHLSTRSAERTGFEQPEEVRRLFTAADMHIETFEDFVRDGETTDAKEARKCVLALLKPGAGTKPI